MSLKPKTVRRLLLLGAVLVLVVGGSVGFLVVRRWQSARLDARLLADGNAAFERADYAGALAHLGRYLTRQGEDYQPGPLITYARARARLEEPDGKHVREGIEVYRRYLSMRPGDREAGIELVRLYSAGGWFPEARDAADGLLPARLGDASEADLPVLREAVRARISLGAFDDRLAELVRRIAELSPTELDAHLTYCDWLARREGAEAAAAYARSVLDAHPSDPRARLLVLLVGLGPPDPAAFDRLFNALCDLTGLDPKHPELPPTGELPDEAYVLRIAALLDEIGRHEHTISLLRAAAEKPGMPGARRLGVRRTWQAGRTDWTIAMTDRVDAADRGTPADEPGFRALALRSEGRSPEAEQVLAALRERQWDFRARAWAAALAALESSERPLDSVLALAGAMKADPSEPVFRHFYGEALAPQGRLEDAIGEWRTVAESPLAIGWALPWVRISQASLELGLVREALEASERAAGLAPSSAVVAAARFTALVAQVERSPGPTGDEADLLGFAEGAAERLASIGETEAASRYLEQLLPGYVLLLSRVGRRAEAQALLDDRLGASPPPGLNVLERLALVSVRENLGREDALLAAAGRVQPGAPSTGAVRAECLHRAGKDAEAVRMLDEAVADAEPGTRSEWEMARAAFLDRIGDPTAGPAWIAVADANPDNLRVQSAALRSPAATRFTGFIDRAAARVAKLTGVADPSSSALRLARARALLAGRPTGRQRDEAVGLIRAVTLDQPRLVEARVLLADTLLLEDESAGIHPDLPGALAELRAAADASLNDAPFALRIAALQQRERDFTGAREGLLQLAQKHPADAGVRRAAADMLAAQGATDDALPIYKALAAESDSPDADLALGEAYALAHRDAEALAVFRGLSRERPGSADQALAAAVWLHRLGDDEAAGRAIDALDDLALDPDQRDLYRGRYEAERAEPGDAIARFRAAVAANPRNAEAWLNLVTVLAQAGETEDAAGAMRDARAALPDDPRLVLLERQLAASSGSGEADLTAFAQALASDPGGAASAEAVRAVADGMKSGRLNTEEGLRALADRFQENLAVQNFAVRRLLEINPPRPEAAARLAERAMGAFPTAPEPARLAAAAYAAVGRWDLALTCAQVWQRRDPRRPVEADAGVAEAHLRLGHPDRALEAVRPDLERHTAQPGSAEFLAAASVGARALLALGRPEEAYALLAPAFPVSSSARLDVLIPIVLTQIESAETARSWLDRAAGSFPGQPPAEKAVLALAYARLAARFEPLRGELASSAESILESLGSGPAASDPTVLEAQGALLEARGDRAGAVEQYRRALEADPGRLGVLGRLAELAADPSLDATPILGIADHAAQTARDPGTLHVIARIYQAIGERAEGDAGEPALRNALKIYRDLLASAPGDMESLLGAASIADRLGEAPAAVDDYSRALAHSSLTGEAKAIVQNNTAYLLLHLNRGPDDLRRARALGEGAVAFSRTPPFLDTLARVEAALGERARAASLFREARRADPGHISSGLGLAELLAGGDAQERAEASRMLADLSAVSESGSLRFTAEQSRALADLRTRVNMEK